MAQHVVELAQSIPIGVTEVEGFHSVSLWNCDIISVVLLPLAKHHYINIFFYRLP